MTPAAVEDRFRPFRERAIQEGIPADDVERWLTLARPCVALARDADDDFGPVVGRCGGPLLLPDDVSEPPYPFVASVDLATLPPDAGVLPLPADGHLLFFALADDQMDHTSVGSVIHVPAGAQVSQRDKHAWNVKKYEEYDTLFRGYPEGELRARTDVSLPCHTCVFPPGQQSMVDIPGHPFCYDLVEAWEETRHEVVRSREIQIGGYADEEAADVDPVDSAVRTALYAAEHGYWKWPVSDDPADWVLLADWYASGLRRREGATLHWVIQREDLIARRLERTFTTFAWNP
ncbi:DUF1963 domain-containing protein [Streptomyces halstedii]|uniref:DUF1963 domain-containing protein n=1 Tax=Streptomyces halstedii TaxID=1944 RepID=UPI0037F836C0